MYATPDWFNGSITVVLLESKKVVFASNVVGKLAVASGAPTTNVVASLSIFKLLPKCPYSCAIGDIIVCAKIIGVNPRVANAVPVPGATSNFIYCSPACTLSSVICNAPSTLAAAMFGRFAVVISVTKLATVVPVSASPDRVR